MYYYMTLDMKEVGSHGKVTSLSRVIDCHPLLWIKQIQEFTQYEYYGFTVTFFAEIDEEVYNETKIDDNGNWKGIRLQ